MTSNNDDRFNQLPVFSGELGEKYRRFKAKCYQMRKGTQNKNGLSWRHDS